LLNLQGNNDTKYIFALRVEKEMNLDVEDDKKEEIGNAIASADSPVGIDTKKLTLSLLTN